MAHMNKEHKARIRVELLKVIPKEWKWGLTIVDRTGIRLTIQSAPVDLCRNFFDCVSQFNRPGGNGPTEPPKSFGFNGAIAIDFLTGDTRSTFERILDALNLDNFDHSVPMNDYFHVGHYVEVCIGTSEAPFVFNEEKVLGDNLTTKTKGTNKKRIRL